MIKMSKNEWNNVKESSGKYLLEPGGYVCAIKDCTDFPDKNYVSFDYDVVKGEDAKFFTNKYEEDKAARGEDKAFWGGRFTRSYDQQGISRWKGLITALENSNPGKFTWNPENPDLTKMKNKYLGLVIGQKEVQSTNGKVYLRNYVTAVKSVESIDNGDFKIPEIKRLEETKTTTPAPDFKNPFEDDEPVVAPSDTPSDNPWADDEDDINPFA